jgi:alpha-L-fucosidase 2
MVLWYDKPATKPGDADSDDGFRNSPAWLRALPLGNGSLGAMVYGDVAVERVRLNEETLWSGVPQDADNPDALAALPEIQRLLIERRYAEAQKLTYEKMVCRGRGSGNGHGFDVPYGSYQTLGDLRIAFDGHDAGDVEDYRRELWLASAAAHVEYRVGELIYRREFFVSHPHQVLAVRLTCRLSGMAVGETLPTCLSFTAALSRPERADVRAERESLAMRGRLSDGSGEDGDAPRGMSYVAHLRAVAEGGTVTAGPDGLRVEGADAVTLLLAAATDYARTAEEADALVRDRIARAARTPYRSLLDAHVRDHSALFSRVSLMLDREDPHRALPTNERLARVRAGEPDTNLASLFLDYGRYLLLASSREDSALPANLQGIWAEGIDTAWSCDYHHDINDQMNYWPAEPTNLSECHRPFLRFIRSLAGPGAKTAKVHYGIEDGWVVHTISNVWGFTSPGEGASWGNSRPPQRGSAGTCGSTTSTPATGHSFRRRSRPWPGWRASSSASWRKTRSPGTSSPRRPTHPRTRSSRRTVARRTSAWARRWTTRYCGTSSARSPRGAVCWKRSRTWRDA